MVIRSPEPTSHRLGSPRHNTRASLRVTRHWNLGLAPGSLQIISDTDWQWKKVYVPAVGILLILLPWDKKLSRPRLTSLLPVLTPGGGRSYCSLFKNLPGEDLPGMKWKVLIPGDRGWLLTIPEVILTVEGCVFPRTFYIYRFRSKYPGLTLTVGQASCFFTHLPLNHVNTCVPPWNSWATLHLLPKKNIF